MGKLIKQESTARGVNFQKASCTLDASVKIYSHRVDDTYASSHRILESLSRNGVGEDDNGNTERAAARVGTKSASNRLNIAETIERNPDQLNSAKVESEHAADPMFHKMSKAFDEGGARGMLMNNLRVTPGTCSLVFTSEGLAQDPVMPDTASPLVDITDLVFKCGFNVSDLDGLTICPTLSDYRKMMGVKEDLTGCLEGDVVVASVWGDVPVGTVVSAPNTSAPAWASESVSSSSAMAGYADEYVPQEDFGDYGADTYAGDDDDDDCDDEGNYIASNRRATMATGMAGGGMAAAPRASLGAPGDPSECQTQKIRWDAMIPSETAGEAAPVQWEGLGAQGGAMTSGNEYAFFDLEALMKSNSWAGARHWRYAAKRAPAASASTDKVDEEEAAAPEEGEEKAKKAKKTNKKEPFTLSFTSEVVSESHFVINAKGRTDTTLMTSAAIEKASAAASEGELFLPVDSKLQARDLCRLFGCPPMLVPPAMLTHMLQPAAQSQGVAGDVIWGQARPVPSSSGPLGYNDYDNGDDDDDGGYGYAGDYGDDRPAPEVEVPEGLALQGDKLLQAVRVVEKLEIGYATVAKRVNVRKLKGDLWSHISVQVGSTDKTLAEGDNLPKAKKSTGNAEKLSFQEVVNDLAIGQQQSEVTLPFYFICLLHLANEKVRINANSLPSLSTYMMFAFFSHTSPPPRV